MMTAMLTVRNILAGARVHDVWAVNEDAEYHEAGREGAGGSAELVAYRARTAQGRGVTRELRTATVVAWALAATVLCLVAAPAIVHLWFPDPDDAMRLLGGTRLARRAELVGRVAASSRRPERHGQLCRCTGRASSTCRWPP